MPFRPVPALCSAVLVLALGAPAARAQRGSAGGGETALELGDYLRVGVTAPSFVSARGLYANYQTGLGGWVNMESWQGSRSGLKMAVGFAGGVSRMQLNQSQFISTFKPLTGGTASSASGGAWLYQLEATFRFLLPSYFVTPTALAGVGFFDFAPGKVTYQSTTGNGTARPLSGSGPMLNGGLALDRSITDRTAVFGEGSLGFAYDSRTGYGGGLVTVKSCSATTCGTLDHQKWVTFADLRGGLRFIL